MAPPDGTRGQQSGNRETEEEEEIEEEDGEDRDNFRSQLVCVGKFFREALDHSLPLLTRLINAKVVALKNVMQRLLEAKNGDVTQLYGPFEVGWSL